MSIFNKGNFQPVSSEFRTEGFLALEELSKFQRKFKIDDTDTTINGIRDAIIANYLGYDLLNVDKHGFDAKSSSTGKFLEVKQCSISSQSWGGTWNDTNEEKAMAFSDERLFTVVGIWKGASDLQCMVYGQSPDLGEHLYRLVVGRKEGSRSTQSITVQKLINDFGFEVICPPSKTKEFVYNLLINYKRNIAKKLFLENVRTIQDI